MESELNQYSHKKNNEVEERNKRAMKKIQELVNLEPKDLINNNKLTTNCTTLKTLNNINLLKLFTNPFLL